MSLSAVVKGQLCAGKSLCGCCKKAFLSGVIHAAATLNFAQNGLTVVVLSDQSDYICSLFNDVFDCENSLNGEKFAFFGEGAAQILVELEIFVLEDGQTRLNEGTPKSLIYNECCKRQYLAGVFVGGGNLTVPKIGYCLEFVLSSPILSADIKRLLELFSIRAALGKKSGKFRTYIKDRECVCDCLTLMGATKAALEINSEIARREVKRDSKAKTNCDLYNLEKTVNTSLLQIEAINYLLKRGELTDEKLLAAAKLRQENPEASYDELKDILAVSKSTIKYRLNKIMDLYNRVKEQKK